MGPECDGTHEVKAQLTAHETLLVFSINPKAAKKERGRGQRVKERKPGRNPQVRILKEFLFEILLGLVPIYWMHEQPIT